MMTTIPRLRGAVRMLSAVGGLMLLSASARAAALLGSGATHPALTVETALIVWHPDTLREHLLLSARIEHADGRIAYVLPTPAEPKVAPVDKDLSAAFAGMIRDYRARTPQWELPTLAGGMLRPWLTFGLPGMADTTVQSLTAEKSLGEALREQGYEPDEAFREWVAGCKGPAPHAVVIHDRAGGTTRTLPYLRVEFESSRPTFPYREPSRPADEVEGSETAGATLRLLRIYVLTTERVAMRLGGSVASMAQAWLSYEPTHEELERALGADLYAATGVDASKRYWVTSFEDYHVVRPGDDDAWFDRLGAIPKDGEPGTVGDRTKAGVALSPIGPAPGTIVAERAAEARLEQGGEAGGGAGSGGLGRRQKTGLLFGAMVGVAVAAWWWAKAKKV